MCAATTKATAVEYGLSCPSFESCESALEICDGSGSAKYGILISSFQETPTYYYVR
jgi:hypothetical protein